MGEEIKTINALTDNLVNKIDNVYENFPDREKISIESGAQK